MKSKIGYGTIVLMLVVALLTGLVGIVGTSGTASAMPKSLYLVPSHQAAAFDAWNILPSGNASYQATYNLAYAEDPSGIAIDESSATLFVSTEFSFATPGDVTVEYVDALTMTSLGYADEGVEDIAGLAVDDVNDILYAVERWTDNLYVFDWDPVSVNLTLRAGYPKDLPGCSGAFGIALDDTAGKLWVCDSAYNPDGGAAEGIVRAYDTTTWLETDNFTPSHSPVDIAVDRYRGFAYTVSMSYAAWTPFGTGSTLLSKYDLSTSTETTGSLADQGVGVAVDEVTGYVYVTVQGYASAPSPYNGDLEVWDCSANPAWTKIDDHNLTGSPAGICVPRSEVGYTKLNVTKDDGVANCVDPGDTINYNICYDNIANTLNVTGVTIVDDLPPEVTFGSATGGGTYNGTTHTVTWDIGNMTAGDPGGCETLTVTVNMGITPGSLITDYVTIDSNETDPKTYAEQTLICREEEPVPVVGGEVYPVNKLGLLAPWIALFALLIPAIMVMRRRRARS